MRHDGTPRSGAPAGVGRAQEFAARPEILGRWSMPSSRGFLAAIFLLLALPIAGVPSLAEPPASDETDRGEE
jgi:hypothetical protein